jgi:hypothetical protein
MLDIGLVCAKEGVGAVTKVCGVLEEGLTVEQAAQVAAVVLDVLAQIAVATADEDEEREEA